MQRNRCRYLVSNYTDNTLDYKALLIVLSLPITFYHRRNQLAVDIVQPPVLEGFQIGLRHPHGGVPQCLADKTDEHAAMEGKRGPGMPRYIEYKNKTQEKCNYCTIYQCISVFYKKNVELHLLLILAIDSVIYSFYVTILLCKKAPVFD